jgi:large subunit ribosomal protein L10
MSKPVKDAMTREYQQDFGGISSACVVSVIGLDAKATNKLRRELLAKNIHLQVVKNSLARRAFVDGPLGPLGKALDGPCALVTGGTSIIDVAKTLDALKKNYPQLELKLGMLEGDPDLVEVEKLAKMKGRMELLADVAACLASPGRKLAAAIASPGGKIAGCLKAMVEKGEEGAEAAPAA